MAISVTHDDFCGDGRSYDDNHGNAGDPGDGDLLILVMLVMLVMTCGSDHGDPYGDRDYCHVFVAP
jgi:hypothetical protein